MNDFLASFPAKWLPRLSGVTAGYLVGEASRHGFTLDPELTTAIMMLVYFVVHRLLSKWLNPGDATKNVLIAEDKATVKNPDGKAIRKTLEAVVNRPRGE